MVIVTGRPVRSLPTFERMTTTQRHWLVVPASAAAAVVVWAVAVPIAGVDLETKAGSRVEHIGVARSSR